MGDYYQWEIIINIDFDPRTLLLEYFIEHKVNDGKVRGVRL